MYVGTRTHANKNQKPQGYRLSTHASPRHPTMADGRHKHNAAPSEHSKAAAAAFISSASNRLVDAHPIKDTMSPKLASK
jgi:hypothetical protein